MGRPKGSKNKTRLPDPIVATVATVAAPARKRRGPNKGATMAASKPRELRELPYCTGEHCHYCGRSIVLAHALPYWHSGTPYTLSSSTIGTGYTPPPPIVSHVNGSVTAANDTPKSD